MKAKLLLAFLLLPLAVDAGISDQSLSNKLRKRDAVSQANSVDLDGVRRFLVKKQTAWTEVRVDEAIAEYRRFLAIGIAYGEKFMVPVADVDEVCEWLSHTTRPYGTS